MKILLALLALFPLSVIAQTENLQSTVDSIQKMTEKRIHELDSIKNQLHPSNSDSSAQYKIRNPKAKRYLIKYPNTNDFITNENCTVALEVVIDENGNIVENPRVIPSQTTTSDSELIKSISESIKTSVLYNACPGAKNETKVITLRLVAQ